ncbi:RNA polymerase sigma-70 factor, expansion family 1 [Galbibacter orientalis DSM 19592]|mgnify:CR=1 FL=1|uniref:RNA polymerase sigma-70 factor, expansion family 1 n=1 Tax=Galbibacter orientalis DSM 19592 TaxID=926559 RepID=I3C8Z1_9FLAO|nr:RNA polymerase sigma-70 factor [Galbibacter orientalis]EIJ40084.1 RNA polymerase sigma-70 factor, expansion family 1 [Galbibacter orientalis DSM 19592]
MASYKIHRNIKLSSEIDINSKEGFDLIFKLYYGKLFHIAKGYLVFNEDAEEIVQNVFLQLLENKDTASKINNLNNYLYTLTKNACLDHLKHLKVKSNFSEQKKKIQQGLINDEAASLLIENELSKRIEEAIALLPEKCKVVFVKSKYEGLKRKEIASILDISPRTVDNHLANALKHMRLHLKEYITYLF